MSEGATPTAFIAESQIDRPPKPRSIRETSLHEASLGLTSILTGLALITPLNAFAGDLLDDPLRGNWSARFLVLGLLAQTGFALHFLASEAGGKTLAGSSAERHPSMPGVRWFSGYHAALADMWAGAVLVVFLIILAAAIPRGVTVFLAAYIALLVWTALLSVVYFLRNITWARETWRSAINPVGLLRQAEAERHVPAFPEDLEAQNRGDNRNVELMIARGQWLLIWDSVAFATWSGVLWVIAANAPGLTATVAFAWLLSVALNILLWYRLYPQSLAR
jgi:hypothetical protein